MDLGLSGKAAFVTGASGGIGQAIARTLAAEGCRVALGCQSHREVADEVAADIEGSGGTALVVRHDLNDPAGTAEAVDTVARAWGGLHVLVTSAWLSPGWMPPDALPEQAPLAMWHNQLRTNVEGTAFTVRAALPHMRSAGWGRIVLISSGAAQDGSPGLEAYATAKAALHGLVRSLARSTGPAGVLANVVLPGLIPTAKHRQTIPQPVLDQIAASTPTRRLATEDDVARVVAFLASAANCSVTGAAVRVSGGLEYQ
jgi:NAD(P)-dependent dehydrogenase (short-subunit alcohol dehydrogenase family)